MSERQVAESVRAVQVGWFRNNDTKFVPISYGAAAERLGFEPVYVLRAALTDGADVGNGAA